MIAPRISFAQNMPTSEERKFNLQVFHAMNRLNEYSKINKNNSADDFVRMFDKEATMIYNDLLGLSAADRLTVEEYADILKSQALNVKVICKNVCKDSIYRTSGGEWRMVVSFNKEISYKNKCGIYFSSNSYYKSDHKMKATFAWDAKSQKVKIVALDGSMNGVRQPLGDEFFVLRADIIPNKSQNKTSEGSKSPQTARTYDPRLAYVTINGKDSIELDSTYNQAIIASSINKAKFKYKNDADVRVKAVPADEEGCNIYKLKFSPTRWRIKAYTELAIGETYNVEIESDMFEISSKGQEYGLEFGYICPSSAKTKFGIFLGAGLSESELTFGVGEMSYSYTSENGAADIDGDDYTRYYKISNMAQTITFKDVFVPFYFNFDRRFGKYFSMYLDLGAKAYFNLEADASDFTAKYTTYGKYEKYDNLTLDYRSGINGFTNNGVLNAENLIQPTLELEPFSLDAFGRLGFRIALAKWLLLDCSAGYQMNVIENMTLSEKTMQTNMRHDDNAIVKYLASSDTEYVSNLLDYAKSAKRQGIKLNIGLMFKF